MIVVDWTILISINAEFITHQVLVTVSLVASEIVEQVIVFPSGSCNTGASLVVQSMNPD